MIEEEIVLPQASSYPPVIMINPETYLAAWQAGATFMELHERSYAGEFVEGSFVLIREH